MIDHIKKFSNKYNVTLLFIFFSIIMFIVNLHVDSNISDDIEFKKALTDVSSFEFVKNYYLNWNGRIAINYFLTSIIVLDPIVWKILNTMIFILLFFTMYKIVLAITGDRKEKKAYLIISICLSIFLLPDAVFWSGSIWVTGSFNYLWPTALGLFSLIPIIYNYFEKEYNNKLIIFNLLAGIYAAYSEQIAAIVITFSTILILLSALKKKKIHIPSILVLAVVIINAIIGYTAPGNVKRFASEASLFPEYETFSVFGKLFYGLFYSLWHLVNEASSIMFIISLLITILMFTKNKRIMYRIMSLVPVAYFGIRIISAKSRPGNVTTAFDQTLEMFNKSNKISMFDNLYDLPKIFSDYNSKSVSMNVSILLGLLVFLCIALSIVKLFGNSRITIVSFLFYMAALASSIVISFSPTIYASGHRVFYATDILLLILLATLLSVLLNTITESKALFRIWIYYEAILVFLALRHLTFYIILY
ncbi:DUF6056 family protein [Paenibacillus sp. B2(2019)]|uniref:DUF6056 family protein n=1 Tax=Paenibacillus sp. B2(2019) TaxID=2607754 RepID=UPI001CB74CFA|nr:DUF6056 family protein [Paenibacillus sp. B2(2019)]